jgi:hypothetical protein
LASEDEAKAFFTGSECGRKAALMAHFLPEFEVNNPGSQRSLVNRSLSAFKLLISDEPTRGAILSRSGGYDLIQRFQGLVGLPLGQRGPSGAMGTFGGTDEKYPQKDHARGLMLQWPRVYVLPAAPDMRRD